MMSRKDGIISFFLLFLGLITRIPFASRMLHHSDSVRFALAMEHYDVTQMRPHAPGYILYVIKAKVLNIFIHDARVSLVTVSIIASALTIVLLYVLALKMFGRSTGMISALLFASSPLYWFNGEMPFTYGLEAFYVIIFGYSCYQIIIGKSKWWPVAALFLALATGVRQNIAIMFFPLWIYTLTRCRFKHILASFLVFGLTCSSWFFPMIAYSGGLKKYLAAVNAQFKTWVLHPAPYLFELKARSQILASFLFSSLSLGVLPMIYSLGHFFRIPSLIKDVRLKFIVLWIISPAVFYVAVSLFNPGLVVIILPPLFIVLAESVTKLARDLSEGLRDAPKGTSSRSARLFQPLFSFKTILVVLVIFLLGINVYTFLHSSAKLSYEAIKKEDNHLSELIRMTEENSSPEKTMVLTVFYNTQAGFYLPDYRIYCPLPLIFSESDVPVERQNVYISYKGETQPKTYWIPTGFRIESLTIPEGIDTLILWEKDIADYYQNTDRPLRRIDSESGETQIYYLEVKPGEKIDYRYHHWSLRPPHRAARSNDSEQKTSKKEG